MFFNFDFVPRNCHRSLHVARLLRLSRTCNPSFLGSSSARAPPSWYYSLISSAFFPCSFEILGVQPPSRAPFLNSTPGYARVVDYDHRNVAQAAGYLHNPSFFAGFQHLIVSYCFISFPQFSEAAAAAAQLAASEATAAAASARAGCLP